MGDCENVSQWMAAVVGVKCACGGSAGHLRAEREKPVSGRREERREREKPNESLSVHSRIYSICQCLFPTCKDE